MPPLAIYAGHRTWKARSLALGGSITEGSGLPMPSSGLWKQAKPWMAKRGGHAESGSLEG
jgi:hypothetical protein